MWAPLRLLSEGIFQYPHLFRAGRGTDRGARPRRRGFVVPPKEYFKVLQKLCQDNGIIFIADEVQTGFGRTGKMFAVEHFEVVPDILVMGKSIAGGLPLSAITGKAEGWIIPK